MPTILVAYGFRFYFYSHEPNEPPHVHVDKGGFTAKLWLADLTFAKNRGFRGKDRSHIVKLVTEHRETILEAWHEHHGEGR